MRSLSKGKSVLVLLFTVSIVAAACGSSGGSSSTATTKAPSTTPKASVPQGGSVTYASDQEPTGWNPSTGNDSLAALTYIAIPLVYPEAFDTTPDFKVVMNKDLLSSAEQTSDKPQTIEFKINPKAVWNDGTPISGKDFQYFWKIQNGKDFKDADVASTTGYDQIKSVTGDGADVTVVFATPYADWKGLFSGLMPAHILKDQKGWDSGLDGTKIPTFSGGPWKFAKYQPQKNVTLVPNDKFWGEKPKLDSIVVRFGLEAPALPQAFENGEIDVAYPQPQVDLLAQLKKLPEIKTQINFGLSFEHMDFNLLNPLLADKAVRQAFAYGLDRTDLVNRTVKQFDSRAEVLNNRIWLSNQPEYEDHAGPYKTANPTKADSVLTAAGYAKGSDGIYAKGGKKLSFRISTTGGNKLREDTEAVIQDQMKKIGIDIKIANVDGSAVFDKFFPESGNFKDADYDIALFAWVGTPFTASSNKSLYETGGGQDETSYANPNIGKLFDEAINTADHQVTVDKTNEIDKEMWKDLPTLPLYAKPTLLPYRSNMVNVVDNSSTAGPLWNASTWGVTKQ